MINLLPESKKKEIKLEGIWKQITAVLLLCFFFFAVFVLLLFLEKFYLEKEVKTQEAKIKRTEKEFDYTAFKNVNNEIIRINKDFTDARNFLLQRISVVDFFRKISALIPPGVNLSEVSSRELTITTNKKTKKKALNIHISGYAKDREDVFLLFNNLKSEKSFQNVDFSPKSWVQPDNVKFSLSLNFVCENESNK
ncbi:PilN domain-containing protein [bacterium]|nr:PilN domain-containing protein [bacterium]